MILLPSAGLFVLFLLAALAVLPSVLRDIRRECEDRIAYETFLREMAEVDAYRESLGAYRAPGRVTWEPMGVEQAQARLRSRPDPACPSRNLKED